MGAAPIGGYFVFFSFNKKVRVPYILVFDKETGELKKWGYEIEVMMGDSTLLCNTRSYKEAKPGGCEHF